VLGIWLWSRAAIWAAALYAFYTFQPNRNPLAYKWDDPRLTHDLGAFTDVWARWDSVWFLRIAEHGYDAATGAASAFYPLYPGTVAVLGRAFFGHYVLAVLAVAMVITGLLLFITGEPVMTRVLYVAIPIAVLAVFFFCVNLYRRSIKFRVTNTVIETERGILSKRIDVLQLWRCRDVRYRQNLSDRILGIAHVDVFAQDATTPHLEIVGMPASRQLFEQLRDSIEIQRQAKNVYGVVS